MDALETYTYKNLTIEIHHDDDPHECPRQWCNFGVMACWHSRYRLGDKDGVSALKEAVFESPRYRDVWQDEDFDDPATLIGLAEKCGIIMLPLYLYDHGGITMNTTGFSCRWDSGQVGGIFVTPEQVREEYGVKRISHKTREKISSVLRSEVEIYDQYLRGEVYGYIIRDRNGEGKDACWGFYGFEDCRAEAESVADWLYDDLCKQRCYRLKTLIRENAPLAIRRQVLKRIGI